jgi:GxxExxY protein
METTLKYGDITEQIIGCAMRVHQKRKNGFVENVYQRGLAIEFEKKGLAFIREMEINVYYERIWEGTRRVDFLIDGKIIGEIKALSELTDAPLAQGLNYLEIHDLDVGLLINVGAKSLPFKRLINQRKQQPQKNPVNQTNPLNPRS